MHWSYLRRPCLDNYDSKAMKWFIISTDKYISHMSSLVATYLIRTSQCFSSSDDVILSTNGRRLNIEHILCVSLWVFFGNYGEKRTSVGGRDTQRLILGFGGNVLCGSHCRMSYWVSHFARNIWINLYLAIAEQRPCHTEVHYYQKFQGWLWRSSLINF